MPRWEVVPKQAPTPKPLSNKEEQEQIEVNNLIDLVMEQAHANDYERRRNTWVGMPLAEDSQRPGITDATRTECWAKHGVLPPTHRQRFDVYGTPIN